MDSLSQETTVENSVSPTVSRASSWLGKSVRAGIVLFALGTAATYGALSINPGLVEHLSFIPELKSGSNCPLHNSSGSSGSCSTETTAASSGCCSQGSGCGSESGCGSSCPTEAASEVGSEASSCPSSGGCPGSCPHSVTTGTTAQLTESAEAVADTSVAAQPE
jgi:hypothetical protein